jgi:hypothetical protein
MAVHVDIDVDLLKSEIKKTYASVSEEPERDFIFPTGRAWAEDLGYPEELARQPSRSPESPTHGPWAASRRVSGYSISGQAPAPTR